MIFKTKIEVQDLTVVKCNNRHLMSIQIIIIIIINNLVNRQQI